MAGTMVRMDPASEGQLVRHARVLEGLATRHGLSRLRRAGDGRLVADIAIGRTYMDVARFELDAQGILGGVVDVILSGTQAAAQVDAGELASDRAA